MVKETSSKFYSEILQKLESAHKKENRLSLIYGILEAIFLSICLIVLASGIEQIFSFDTVGRTVIFVFSSFVFISFFSWLVIRNLLFLTGIIKSGDNYKIAVKVGNYYKEIRDRLLDAIQMYEERDKLKQYYSLTLIDASFGDLYNQAKELDFSEAISERRIPPTVKRIYFAAATLLILFIISPYGFRDSLYRIVKFNTPFTAPLAIQFYIEPGNAEAIRGQNVNVTIQAKGKFITNLLFFSRQKGQMNFEQENLKQKSEGLFATVITSIKATTEYYASVEEVKSEKYVIKVIDRPMIRTCQLKIISPLYTRIPPKILESNTGDINSYLGSKAEIQIVSSKELSSARIESNDSSVHQLHTAGTDANGAFTIKKNCTYHLLLKDKDGLSNIDPVEYSIKIIADEYPKVEILNPGKNVDLAEQLKLDLFIRIKDDFGFSDLKLFYRLIQSKYEKPPENYSSLEIPLVQKFQNQIDTWYHWDLSSMNLVPEDVVEYYAEVFDNDNISGPKASRSETYLIRLPSLEEVFTDISDSYRESVESMQNIAKETEQLKKDVEDFQQNMKKNREKSDWQQQKKAETMLQQYDTMKKQLDKVSKKLDEMVNKMDENKLLSDETMQKYLELQKLMEQLNSPELREALKKLQESMKQISPEQMKQALEKLKLSEDDFRKMLDRTLELLKRIHIEQKLDELIKRTEELMKQQKALEEQTQKTNPSDSKQLGELAKQQEDLQKQMEALEKETAELKQKMEEFPKEMPLDEMAKAEQQLQQNQTGKKMQKSSQDIQSGNIQSAQQNQHGSEENLNEFKKQLEQVKKSMLDEQMKQIVNQMRKELEDILELSKREETLKDKTKNLDPNSQQFRNNAQEQNGVLSDLSNVANALGDLSKKTFAISPEMGKEIGGAMNQMGEAMKQMEMRNPGGSSQNQNEAMGSLNRAAAMMQNTLNGMMEGGQSGMGMAGLLGRLQQMAGMQGSINAGTQQALGMGNNQGDQLTAEQQEAYQRLAGGQGSIKKSLEELAKEAKNAGEYSRLLGDLDRIAQEMMEVQSDLQQGNVNPNTLQKQERILSRLLESTKSMREQDYEKRRRAEAGKNILRSSPTDIDLTTQEGRNKLREELLKAIEGKYTKDYEELIKKYFEQLEKEETKQ